MPSDPVLKAKFECRRNINQARELLESGKIDSVNLDKLIYDAKHIFMVPDAYPLFHITIEWLDKRRVKLVENELVRNHDVHHHQTH